MKQFGNPPLSKRTPLSTNPPISDHFFHDPPLCPNFKNKNPAPPPSNFRGAGNDDLTKTKLSKKKLKNAQIPQVVPLKTAQGPI